MRDEKIIVCILNKNDGKNLKTLENKIKNVNRYYTTYLIDGNSTDDSVKIAENFGINISNFGSLSRGDSIKECINKFKKDFEYIIFTSSDGEENLDDISYFKQYFLEGADLVIGSRLKDGGKFKSDSDLKWIHRKLYLKLITYLINIFFNGELTDCWNGFRGFRMKCFENIKLTEKNYLVEAETTIKFLKKRYVVKEFPTIEYPRKYGNSSNSVISSGFGHLKLLLREIIFK
mgnify:CR=1 FL=1|tara:strand:+ start:4852 stop:5547 length:696 start_codon:yes stop_codon:yes gene_type:complete